MPGTARLLVFAAVLGACAAHAQTDPAEYLANVIRDNGCRMTEAEAEEKLPTLGFNREQVSRIVARWLESGYARRDGDTLVLLSEHCR